MKPPRMHLAARLAAARWAAGGRGSRASSGGRGWSAVALRWRRVRRSHGLPSTRTGRAAGPMTGSVLPRPWPLVLRLPTVERIGRVEPGRQMTATGARSEVRGSRALLPPPRLRIAAPVAAAVFHRAPVARRAEPEPTRRHAATGGAAGRILAGDRERSVVQRPAVAMRRAPAMHRSAPAAAMAAARLPAMPAGLSRDRARPALDRRAECARADRPALVHASPDRVAARRATPDLMWRQAARASGSAAPEPHDGIGASGRQSGGAVQRSSIARETAAPIAVSAAAPRSTVASAPAYDAAFVDRLAEDVMRRVERRVRIERERRGL